MTDHFYNAIKSWSDKNPPSQQDKIDTSSEAVRLHSPYHDGSMVLDNDGGWVSIDDYRDLSARVAELEALTDELDFLLNEGGKDSCASLIARAEAAEQRAATLEAKLAKAVDALEWVRYGGGPHGESAHMKARATLAEIQDG